MKKIGCMIMLLCVLATSVPAAVQSAEMSGYEVQGARQSTLVAFTKDTDADVLAAEVGIAAANQSFVSFEEVFGPGEIQGSRNMAVDVAKLKEMLAKREQEKKEGAAKDEMRRRAQKYARLAFCLAGDKALSREQGVLTDLVKDVIADMVERYGSSSDGGVVIEQTKKLLCAAERVVIHYLKKDGFVWENVFLSEELVPHRTDMIFCKAIDIDPEKKLVVGGMTKALALLFLRCFEDFDKILQEHPDATDEVLIALFWPVIIEWTREFQSLEAFQKSGELDEVMLAHEVYQENVWRFAFDSDAMYVPTMKGDKTSHNVTNNKPEGAAELHQFIRSIYGDRTLFETLWKEHFWWRYAQIGVPQTEIDQMFEEQYAAIMREIYVDIVKGRAAVFKVSDMWWVKAHARTNITQKHDYDGKKYGVFFGEGLLRSLGQLGKRGREMFAWIVLEESQHFALQGRLKADWEMLEKYGDHQLGVVHGAEYRLITSIVQVAMLSAEKKFGVDFLKDLLKPKEAQGVVARMIMRALDMCLTGEDEILNHLRMPFSSEADITAEMNRFLMRVATDVGYVPDEAGAVEMALNCVFDALNQYGAGVVEAANSHNNEKGYVPYLKSA